MHTVHYKLTVYTCAESGDRSVHTPHCINKRPVLGQSVSRYTYFALILLHSYNKVNWGNFDTFLPFACYKNDYLRYDAY